MVSLLYHHCLHPTSPTLVSAVLSTELPCSFTCTEKPVCVSRACHYRFWEDQGSQGTEHSCSDCGHNSLQLMNPGTSWHPIDSCTASVKRKNRTTAGNQVNRDKAKGVRDLWSMIWEEAVCRHPMKCYTPGICSLLILWEPRLLIKYCTGSNLWALRSQSAESSTLDEFLATVVTTLQHLCSVSLVQTDT